MVAMEDVLVPSPGVEWTPGALELRGEQHPLSPTAEAVWEKLDGERSLQEVVEALHQEFGVDPDIGLDVRRLADVLRGHGLVTIRRSDPPESRSTVAVPPHELPWSLVRWARGGPAPLVVGLTDDEWGAALAVLRRHHLVGWLADALERTGQVMEDRRMVEIHRQVGGQAIAAQQIEDRLVLVHDLFAGAGIEHRVLKGSALAALDYRSSALRPTGDLDVLVGRDELLYAAALLESSGATRVGSGRSARHDTRLVKAITERFEEPRVEVDLHAELVAGPFGMWMDSRRCFEEQRVITRRDRSIPALSVSDAFVHACYVAVIGNWTLRPMAVLDLLVLAERGPDPERVWDLARAWRGEVVISAASVAAAEVVPTDRELVRPWMDPPSRTPLLSRLVLRVDGAPPATASTARFRRHVVRELLAALAAPTGADRLALVTSLVLPEHRDRSLGSTAIRAKRVGLRLVGGHR